MTAELPKPYIRNKIATNNAQRHDDIIIINNEGRKTTRKPALLHTSYYAALKKKGTVHVVVDLFAVPDYSNYFSRGL